MPLVTYVMLVVRRVAQMFKCLLLAVIEKLLKRYSENSMQKAYVSVTL
jgi:hypothetical protein